MDDKEKIEFTERINCSKQKRDRSFQRYFSPDYKFYKKLRGRISWIEQRLVGPRILDAGCSEGIVCYVAAKREDIREIHGLDLQTDILAQAVGNVKNDKVYFHHGFAEEIPFGNGYFDTVVMGEVLEHVFSEKESVIEAARVLRPAGKVVITIPNDGNLSFAHIRSFNKNSLTKLLTPHFNIKEMTILYNFLACVGEKR